MKFTNQSQKSIAKLQLVTGEKNLKFADLPRVKHLKFINWSRVNIAKFASQVSGRFKNQNSLENEDIFGRKTPLPPTIFF